MSINPIISQETVTTVSSKNKIKGADQYLCSTSTKTIATHKCDHCGHEYERKGMAGFFEEMYQGCPSCGYGKEDWV